ncbi:transcriptional regulator containing PAS, AAA-type ATPase, and DNA-binding domains [Moorella thermoacetica Y72]|uniref:Formate hydrogenlyase transcriptional activator n=2 Tax=Neomoorella thermoacetica TaxID=1525 RepID=A0A1J5JDJ2_NEOTH|nr:sigma 54-interacting transcriptional regulator [Moorella thermoacetica]OIQ07590.1 formate hydrogenlyase transcriptional activator [Moorella thermoacetica]GAF25132.1 transcriptional regulator containing PAS, AAA-type ATPase, and DNA-binding domains [Moorella thermoacetica Y72]
MNKILVISPFEEFTNLILQVKKESKFDFDVLYNNLGMTELEFFKYSTEQAKRFAQESRYEVIVTRGGSYLEIKKNVDIPVVEVKITMLDVLRTVHNLKKNNITRIGLMGYLNIIQDSKELGELLGVKVYPVHHGTNKELEYLIHRALNEGIEIIVGDGLSVSTAAEYGLPGLRLIPQKETVIEALHTAKTILYARKQERLRHSQFAVILNSSSEGIMVIDEQNRITLFNPKMEELFGLNCKEVIGKDITNVFESHQCLIKLLQAKEENSGDVIELNGKHFALKLTPIAIKDQFLGMVANFQDVTRLQMLEHSVRRKLVATGLKAKNTIDNLIGESKAMQAVKQKIKCYARYDSTVLIYGESGTGKEIIAQSIHNLSERRYGPFVAVNCAALPENLLESELFGYAPGAFTGALKEGKAGLFELAHNGTIFLDEIGEMPVSLQARLLRVIQEKEVMRLGGNKVIPINIKIIAATNRNLKKAVIEKTFREDLYYRLNILTISVPPLKDRIEDIPVLCKHILKKLCQHYKKNVPILPDTLHKLFQQYTWPGNIRELENILERIVVMSSQGVVPDFVINEIIEELSENNSSSHFAKNLPSYHALAAEMDEQKWILAALKEARGNKTLAAKRLGMNRTTLWRKLKKFNIAESVKPIRSD